MAEPTVALSNSPPQSESGAKRQSAKRAAVYVRVSTGDQHPESQLYDSREMAKQRGYEIVHEYSDVICCAKSKRPGLDQLMADARRYRFDVVLVAAFDRVARSVRHFLEVLDELNHLGIEFVSFRENIDTDGPLGRAMVVIVGAIAELERSLIVERVKAGMRRAKLEGRRIGRVPLDIDREQVVRDRRSGMSLRQLTRKHGISRASVCRLVKESERLKKANVPQVGNQKRAVLFVEASNSQATA
jgi:DNA invertase Pin-like site-specific DNA recombinase